MGFAAVWVDAVEAVCVCVMTLVRRGVYQDKGLKMPGLGDDSTSW